MTTNENKDKIIKRIKRLQNYTYTRGIGLYTTSAKCGEFGVIRRLGGPNNSCRLKRGNDENLYIVSKSKKIRNGGYYTKDGLIKAILATK